MSALGLSSPGSCRRVPHFGRETARLRLFVLSRGLVRSPLLLGVGCLLVHRLLPDISTYW
jgi:hypothetical protein